jgi:hypothetical protein
MTGQDQARWLNLAKQEGWEIQATGAATLMERDGQTIEIEYGSAGIPRRIRRVRDGKTQILTQNYIRMAEVLGWITEKPEGDKTDDRRNDDTSADDDA